MADPAANLAALLRRVPVQDHDEVVKLANAAIKANKGNLDAYYARIVALLKLDRFDDALRAIAEAGTPLESRCQLEKTYALYKAGQLEEAQKTAASSSLSSRAFRHLAGQIAYRAEQWPDAAAIYRRLAINDDSDDHDAGLAGEENDVNINLLATNAQLQWSRHGDLLPDSDSPPSREHLDAFETAYNAACAHIARADFAMASVLLKRARDLCEASEDLSADDKHAELLPIMVQHIYVLSQLGKHAEATALQKQVVASDIPEAPTRAVAQNNEAALAAAESNPYLAQRIADAAVALSGNDKLFHYQQSIMQRNALGLGLQMQKFKGTKASTHSQICDASSTTGLLDAAHLGVINAAARAQLGAGKDAIKAILPALEKRPNDIGLLFTIIQLYVQTKNPGPALALLETFLKRLETATTPDYANVRYAPGLVAVAVALYRTQGRQNSIRAELAKASTHWRSRSNRSSISLLLESGIELLRSSNPSDVEAAGASFEKLVSSYTRDATAAAGLVASFATRDYDKVSPYLSKLTSVERLTAGIDVKSLVDAGVAAVTPTAPSIKRRAAVNEPERGQATKRRRKKRLPKDYDQTKQPDPERWLPLRDRSSYRPKGKKGKKRAHDTQGGVVKEEETLELVGGAGAVKVEKATGGQSGKKKKKGKK
ncbi:hypothetical protein GGR57DRAFT_487774 [Xylariaceae sp. FL1272]|nr:hypothetical protein GGR57DRAFT_487774 [Xylariaceae sp. FL1272]